MCAIFQDCLPCLWGISRVDGVPVAGRAAGAFGPVTQRLQAAYWGLHEDARYVETVSYD